MAATINPKKIFIYRLPSRTFATEKKQQKGTESFPSLFHLHEYREKNRNNPWAG
jgi:hypothetical protein